MLDRSAILLLAGESARQKFSGSEGEVADPVMTWALVDPEDEEEESLEELYGSPTDTFPSSKGH